MALVKAFVRPDDSTTISCPSCNTAKQVSVGQYRGKRHRVKTRCNCNTIFTIQLDFRHHYRKKTNLPGTYHIVDPPGGGGGVIHIQNISQSGIGFSVSGRHSLKPDQTVQLEFRLNDKQLTKLIKRAQVRSVNSNYIGCRFEDPELIEKALGFYLRR